MSNPFQSVNEGTLCCDFTSLSSNWKRKTSCAERKKKNNNNNNNLEDAKQTQDGSKRNCGSLWGVMMAVFSQLKPV